MKIKETSLSGLEPKEIRALFLLGLLQTVMVSPTTPSVIGIGMSDLTHSKKSESFIRPRQWA